jgi:hypothetical protein
MSNYVPYNRKKKEILARREQELLHALGQAASRQDLIRAAEDVRAAQLRVLAAERATVPPCEKHAKRLAPIDAESRRWANMPVEVIVAEYRSKLPKNGRMDHPSRSGRMGSR